MYVVYVLVLSILGICVLASENPRVLVGGYSLGVNWLIPIVGAAGLFVSLAALTGIHDNTTTLVWIFTHFATFRIAIEILVLIIDWTFALSMCEQLTIDGSVFTSVTGHFNMALEVTALSGACQRTKQWYMILSIIDIVISTYGVYEARQWCRHIDATPSYKIQLDETRPLPIYTGYTSIGAPDEEEPPPQRRATMIVT